MKQAPDSPDQATVLVVDDIPENLTLMHNLLKGRYRIRVANNGEHALRIARSAPPPNLILLDIMMPAMDGYEVCRQLKFDTATRPIPVIFLTARSEASDETRGFELGAVDYITKPISPPILLARVETHLAMERARQFLRDQNAFLEAEVSRRTREIELIQDATVQALASLAETRDNETGNHIRRTQHYVRLLAERLRRHPRFMAELDDDRTIALLFKSAPLHDIGKVGIPDRILLKPGKLDPEEFEIMKTHATLGRDAIEQAEREVGGAIPFLRYAKEIAYGHQEKWDGSGYPQGLAGEAIPVSARLMSLADVYDALISQRIYKPPYSHARARNLIVEGKGTHFDPAIVDAFLDLEPDFRAIALRYADG